MSTSPAEYFSTRLTHDPSRAAVWRHIAAYLQRWVREDGALLDLAAGYADFAQNVRAAERVAMDANPDLPNFLGSVASGVRAEVGDCTDLSRFDDGRFDTVMASNFFEHLEWAALERCIGEVRRVLRPGGRLLVVQPNFRLAPKQYFDDYTHRTIFTDRSLVDFLRASGFDVDHVEGRFLPLTVKSRLSRGHFLVPIYLRLPPSLRPLAGQMLVVASKASKASEGGR